MPLLTLHWDAPYYDTPILEVWEDEGQHDPLGPDCRSVGWLEYLIMEPTPAAADSGVKT